MKIALVYNERPQNYDRIDPLLEKHIEGDEWKTVKAIGQAIASHHHTVEYFKIDDTIYERLKTAKSTIDLLFNLSEGVSEGSDREAQIPMIAQILAIPHTGPGPLSAALILNKSRAKEIWRANGVNTPDSQLFTSRTTLLKKSLSYPLIVKPSNEGSGIGIKAHSIVKNVAELRHAITLILNEYHQPALIETYLPGREFTVALIGNEDQVETLPIVEINFAGFPAGVPPIDSYEAKFIYGATGMVDMHATEFCPALITPKLAKQINNLAVVAYKTIGCQDFGRVDIRLDDKGIPAVIEINHPPGMMSDPNESSFFTIAAKAQGWTFAELIGRILKTATTRLKLV